MMAQVTTPETAAMAIMAICLIFCTMAMAGTACLMAWILYKRVGKRDDQVAMDIGQMMVDAWNAGSETRQGLIRDSDGAAQIEVQRRRSNQNWNPAADEADQRGEPDSRQVAVFGETAIIPEMNTRTG